MVSPLGIPQYMPNAAAAAVSMKYGLQGQMYGVVSACSSGAHAIGSALRMIQYGDADAVVAGGAEATLTAFGFACFNSMQALSPTGISRPFDARRDGFVMGEGAGVLVLEEAEAAAARGATVLGEVVGLRLDLRRLPPDRARAERRGRRARDRAGARRRRRSARTTSTTSTPTAPRRSSTTPPRRPALKRALGRGAGQRDPDLLDQVRDRAPARRRRRGRGGRDGQDAGHAA